MCKNHLHTSKSSHSSKPVCCCCHDDHNAHNHHEHEHHHHHHDIAPKQWISIALSAILLIIGIFFNPSTSYPWLIFLLAYIPVGYPIFKEAFGEIKHGDIFNEFTLMIIATIGAFGIGEYPEAIAVLLFYSLGEYFQGRAVGRAQHDIQGLISLRPDHATVISNDGERTTCAPEQVNIHQIIEIKAGERVPLDGRLCSGQTDFDAAALTGESVPRTLQPNDEVLAGMIALNGPVQIEVVRPYAESALQRILTLVQDAAQHKSPAERFIRRFARIYTPTVTILAGLIALVPPLITAGSWDMWFYRALVFLVISCPCALVVSIPLCYFRGIGIASRHGILFKGGNYLDAVTRIGQVVFDKTGTLTSGQFGMVQVVTHNGYEANTLLRYAAALERYSTHPLAQALVRAYDPSDELTVTHVEECSGHGMKGRVNEHEVLVGHADFLQQEHIDIPDTNETDSAYTFVYCAVDGFYVGKVALADQPRPDASDAIARLRHMDIRDNYILSGDRHTVVRALANKIGIDKYYGNLLPEDKARIFSQIKNSSPHRLTAFVGDGINDAPVLALSDVGIAMGQGSSDVAVETADIVIHNNRPSSVADAISIGRNTQLIVRQNLVLAIGLKIAILLLGMLGLTGLWAAVLADTGVALLCVANTYRIKK